MKTISCWEALKLLKELELEQLQVGNQYAATKDIWIKQMLGSRLDSLLLEMSDIKHKLEEVEITIMG